MIKICKMLIIVVITSAFFFVSSAKEPEEYVEEFESIVPEQAGEIADLEKDISSLIGFRAIISEVISALEDGRGELFSFLALLFGSAILLSLSSAYEGGLSDVAETGVGAVVSLLIFSRIGKMFSEISASLSLLSEFFSAFIPIAVGITAAAGGVGSSIAQNSGMNITLWLLGGVGNSFFISVVGFGLAMSLITAFGDESAARVAKGVKNFFVFTVGTVSAVLGATLSLQTVVASASDSAAMRAARYAASGFIPVVGAAVSGALSTLVSGLTYAKDLIGAGGIAVIVVTSLSPLVMLLAYRLCIVCVCSFAELCGRGRAASLFNSFRFSLDSMIALYTTSVLVYIINIVIFIKGGVAS